MMFEKVTQMIRNLQINQNPFDPAQFNDPIATQTSWKPAKGGGTNFRTFKLTPINSNRVEFKTTIGAIIFALVFALPGIALLIFLIPNLDWSSLKAENVIPLLLGLVFASIGGCLFYSQMIPIVFDRQAGLYWKGPKPQVGMMNDQAKPKYARLESVHALQIIAEYIRGKNGGYHSFELNLVLQNGDRINVVDHGNRNKLLKDADALAEFLGVPLWDATTY